MHFGDDSLYVGEFFLGRKQVKGKYEWTDGALYSGEFIDDNIAGYGEMEDDQMTYRGYFRNGLKQGTGECVWREYLKSSDGRIPSQHARASCEYSGHFENDMLHGEGQLKYAVGSSRMPGRTYEGQF